MINTSWEDDGEALKGLIWHGHAWAAECSWNGSTTEPEAFNRRVGAVLFGEQGDHFGQAIRLLAKTHELPGMAGMNNSRFWQDDFFSAAQRPRARGGVRPPPAPGPASGRAPRRLPPRRDRQR